MHSSTPHTADARVYQASGRSRKFGRATCLALLALCAYLPPAWAVAQEAAAFPAGTTVQQQVPAAHTIDVVTEADATAVKHPAADSLITLSRTNVLIGSFTIFMLAVFVGFEIITKVPPTLHTPLMSGSNAISGITVVGAILTAGAAATTAGDWFGTSLGMVATVLAMINVVGGFMVTHRMLVMFKKR